MISTLVAAKSPVVAIVSGVVLYAPFMRRLPFGAVRTDRLPRVKWLDLHNLLAIVTLAWAVVVGLTGVINTWADLVLKVGQADQLASMVAPYRGKPPATPSARLQAVVETAQRAAPQMALDLITIVVLAAGLYLWMGRRRMAADDRIAAFEPVSAAVPQGRPAE